MTIYPDPGVPAQYRCMRATCGCSWEQSFPSSVECRRCGSKHVEWLNFELWLSYEEH